MKHSVERDVREFCGWPTLERITTAAREESCFPMRDAGFIGACFNTGGRVSEVLGLKPSMFEVYKGCTPKLIVVKGMPLLKRYKKIGELIDDKGKKHYETEHLDLTRDFCFRTDEPMIKPFVVWLAYAFKNQYNWLFPSPVKSGEPLSRNWGYWVVSKAGDRVGMELYPHWLRAQRASQLAVDYDLKEATLLEWFQWEKWETAKKYCKAGVAGMAKRMGVTFNVQRGVKVADITALLPSTQPTSIQ